MDIVILTPVRLFGQGLTAYLGAQEGFRVLSLADDMQGLRAALTQTTEIALVDVTHGYPAEEVRALAAERPGLKLIALGLREQQQEVVSCGRSGFCDYVPRDATLEVLVERMRHALDGRMACSAEMASALMRALFHAEPYNKMPDVDLTPRQSQVAHLLERGLSNKEMALEMDLSLGTVKHHVQGVLDRLGVNRRGKAMRMIRNAPWKF